MNLLTRIHPGKFPVTELGSNIQGLALLMLDFSRKSKYITSTIVPLTTLSVTVWGDIPAAVVFTDSSADTPFSSYT